LESTDSSVTITTPDSTHINLSVGLATDPTLVRNNQNNVYSPGTTQSFDGITFGGNVDYIAGTSGKVGIYNASGNAYFGGKVWVGDFSSFSKVNSTTGFEFNYTPGYTGTKKAGACVLTIPVSYTHLDVYKRQGLGLR